MIGSLLIKLRFQVGHMCSQLQVLPLVLLQNELYSPINLLDSISHQLFSAHQVQIKRTLSPLVLCGTRMSFGVVIGLGLGDSNQDLVALQVDVANWVLEWGGVFVGEDLGKHPNVLEVKGWLVGKWGLVFLKHKIVAVIDNCHF